jgi:hypothetical protein
MLYLQGIIGYEEAIGHVRNVKEIMDVTS